MKLNETVVNCQNLKVAYGKKTILEIPEFGLKTGETAILMGPSGCGKTTFLKAISGIIPYEGEITRTGKLMMMFQRPCVLPQKTVLSNIEYVAALCRAEKLFVDELIEKISVREILKQYPYQLSGGQLQRVSLLICLLVKPNVLLLDEPFSALDYTTRFNMILILKELKERLGLSYIIVNHTIDDIEVLGNKFIYMHESPAKITLCETSNDLQLKLRSGVKMTGAAL